MSRPADDIAHALSQAKARLRHAESELDRHLTATEPSEPHAVERHARVERKLRDDIALAQCDVSVLSPMLAAAAQSAASGESDWL
jgi:hypothetical protein